jgi:hypothetical protein
VKHTTTWRPDTCGCVIDIEWDDGDAPRVHKAKRVSPCPDHQGDAEAVFAAVLDENRRKNSVLPIAEAAGIQVNSLLWWWGPGRVLNVSLAKVGDKGDVSILTLSTAQRSQLKAALDSALGAGKVKVA